MELLGMRQPFSKFQEEKYQMLELNQRLESYLGRVKLLEEENKLLREEIHTLKSNREAPEKRRVQEEALNQARRIIDEAWRKKDRVELEIENLMEDVEKVSIQRQKIKTAKVEAQRKLLESRKELEDENRAQIWLKKKVGQLEKDLLLHIEEHQENKDTLESSLKHTKKQAPYHIQTISVPDLDQEYSSRAAQAWQEAVTNFQQQAERLEESLSQTKANMGKIHQEKRENQLHAQQLAKELESTKDKRQILEKHVMQQREEQKCELQHLQDQVDWLESEKHSLGQQIDGLMYDRQNLLQMKMSLGLEVATYRALLDSEGLKTGKPPTNKNSSAYHSEVLSKLSGIQSAICTTGSSCYLSSTVSPSHRSIMSSHSLLSSVTPSWTPSQGTIQKPKTKNSEKLEFCLLKEIKKAAEDYVDNSLVKKLYDDSPSPKSVAELEFQFNNINVEDEAHRFCNAKMNNSKTDESGIPANQLKSLPLTPETEMWAAGDPEEEKDEDIEVSVEMTRISHAPTVAWEENKTGDEKDDAFETHEKLEIISKSYTFAHNDKKNENEPSCQNIGTLDSSLFEQGTLDLMANGEETLQDLKMDELDHISNASDELDETETAMDSINEWERQEETNPNNETKLCVDEEEETIIKVKDKTQGEEEKEETEKEVSLQDKEQDSSNIPDHVASVENTTAAAELHQDQRESHPFPEQLEENPCDEDDSPNVSASLRSDAGDCDSQENTLADTRPLIRYKSDEETSHHIGETSDSEDEKDRMDRGNWNESASKRFNTMEDLTEEPDMDVTGEMLEEVSKVEELEEDKASMMIQNGIGESLNLIMQELQANEEESRGNVAQEICGHEESVNQQWMETKLPYSEKSEDQLMECEEEVGMVYSSTFSGLPNQDHLEESFQIPSISQSSTTTKEPEDLLNVSMHTNIDPLDNSCLVDELDSLQGMTSYLPEPEECNSSADESPNASQCFQKTSLLKVADLTEEPITFANGVSEAATNNNVLPVEELCEEKSTDEDKVSQSDAWESSEILGQSMGVLKATETTYASIDRRTDLFMLNEDLESKLPTFPVKFEEHQVRSDNLVTETNFETYNFEQVEEFQSKQSKSEIHSYFTDSMKGDFWDEGKMEMAATYVPSQTENFEPAMVFGDEWKEEHEKQSENGNAKEEMDIKEVEVKKKGEQPGQGKIVLSDESAEEGDSWSSGDE